MDQYSQPKEESFTSDTPPAYAATAYQPVVMVSGSPAAGTVFPPGSQGVPVYPVNPGPPSDQNQIPFQVLQQQQQDHQQQQLQALWAEQMAEIEQMSELKLHSLPLARIKRIMKADEDVRMIAGEAPAVFAKACEMFILELTLRAWFHAQEKKRRTLQMNDVAAAVARTDIFDFLLDIMPEDALKEAGAGLPLATMQAMVPSYAPGMTIPLGMYANQQPLAWTEPEQQQQQQQQPYDGGQDN
jgi:nuclear transcription factor Y gamma